MPVPTKPDSSPVKAFDNEAYLKEQTASILERVERFNHKLYLEFGGKIMFDYHAARVLPGFDPNVKMRLLQKLKDKIDIILCIHAGAIERKKIIRTTKDIIAQPKSLTEKLMQSLRLHANQFYNLTYNNIYLYVIY